MITVSIDPIIFSFGHFMIRWYGIIVTAAIVVGVGVGMREARRKGFVTSELLDNILWIILAGLAGARLFHVLDHWQDEFASNPVRIFYIWEGGLAIWGAVVGGLIALWILARFRHWKLLRLLDAAAPGLVLAQAVGRIACVITGDAMGKPTAGPFGFAYTSPNAMVPELGIYYTPMPVYEILMNLTIFGVLWALRKRLHTDGGLFFMYLALYSFGRFWIGFTSSYQIMAFGLAQSQIVALIGMAASIVMLAKIKRTQRRELQPV
jgi:phosphatidylglycerol:prolipoprotein diacylglycerol transferase